MDLLDAINKYILVIYEGLTDKVEEVANLIAMSPGELFATDLGQSQILCKLHLGCE